MITWILVLAGLAIDVIIIKYEYKKSKLCEKSN